MQAIRKFPAHVDVYARLVVFMLGFRVETTPAGDANIISHLDAARLLAPIRNQGNESADN